MNSRKMHANRETIRRLFPIQGYGDTHYSRDEEASYPVNGWWTIKPSPLVKGAAFKARRGLCESARKEPCGVRVVERCASPRALYVGRRRALP